MKALSPDVFLSPVPAVYFENVMKTRSLRKLYKKISHRVFLTISPLAPGVPADPAGPIGP